MFARWLRMRLNQRVLKDLKQQRWELAQVLMREVPAHPHTQGLYDGISRAIDAIETEYH